MKIHATLPTGAVKDFDAAAGQTLMDAMRKGGAGVRAECGGAMACASCHVVIDDAWIGRVGKASSDEGDLLDGSDYRMTNSRLSCQIMLADDLDGLKLAIQLDAFEG